jgi:hypothetical protein
MLSRTGTCTVRCRRLLLQGRRRHWTDVANWAAAVRRDHRTSPATASLTRTGPSQQRRVAALRASAAWTSCAVLSARTAPGGDLLVQPFARPRGFRRSDLRPEQVTPYLSDNAATEQSDSRHHLTKFARHLAGGVAAPIRPDSPRRISSPPNSGGQGTSRSVIRALYQHQFATP